MRKYYSYYLVGLIGSAIYGTSFIYSIFDVLNYIIVMVIYFVLVTSINMYFLGQIVNSKIKASLYFFFGILTFYVIAALILLNNVSLSLTGHNIISSLFK